MTCHARDVVKWARDRMMATCSNVCTCSKAGTCARSLARARMLARAGAGWHVLALAVTCSNAGTCWRWLARARMLACAGMLATCSRPFSPKRFQVSVVPYMQFSFMERVCHRSSPWRGINSRKPTEGQCLFP